MREEDNLNIRGQIKIAKIRDGMIVEEYVTPNTVVTSGKGQVSGLINGVITNFFEYLGVGTGTTAPAAAQTALVGAVDSRVSATTSRQTTTTTNDTARLVNQFIFTSAYAITECGVFDSSTAGKMLARGTFGPVNVASGDAITLTYDLILS